MKQSLEQLLRNMHDLPEAAPNRVFAENARIRIINKASFLPESAGIWTKLRATYHVFRVALGTALATALMGGSVVYAAQFSGPQGALYPVKVTSEQVALSLAPTKALKTQVATTVIDRRAKEIEDLKTSGSADDVSHAVDNFHETVSSVAHLSGVDEEDIARHIKEHEDLFAPKATEGGTRTEGNREDSGDRSIPLSPTMTAEPLVTPSVTKEAKEGSSSVEGAQTTSEDLLRTDGEKDDH